MNKNIINLIIATVITALIISGQYGFEWLLSLREEHTMNGYLYGYLTFSLWATRFSSTSSIIWMWWEVWKEYKVVPITPPTQAELDLWKENRDKLFARAKELQNNPEELAKVHAQIGLDPNNIYDPTTGRSVSDK